uniref:Uncharacterized protein n=1 Tax=Arundo donax TaxID=35708 RepID=A0A0A8Y152_ARUDO
MDNWMTNVIYLMHYIVHVVNPMLIPQQRLQNELCNIQHTVKDNK